MKYCRLCSRDLVERACSRSGFVPLADFLSRNMDLQPLGQIPLHGRAEGGGFLCHPSLRQCHSKEPGTPRVQLRNISCKRLPWLHGCGVCAASCSPALPSLPGQVSPSLVSLAAPKLQGGCWVRRNGGDMGQAVSPLCQCPPGQGPCPAVLGLLSPSVQSWSHSVPISSPGVTQPHSPVLGSLNPSFQSWGHSVLISTPQVSQFPSPGASPLSDAAQPFSASLEFFQFVIKQLQFSTHPLLSIAGICPRALCPIPGLSVLAPQQNLYPLGNPLGFAGFCWAEASPLPGFPGLCQIFL